MKWPPWRRSPKEKAADRARFSHAAATAARSADQLDRVRKLAQQIEKSGTELRETRLRNHIGPSVVASFQRK